MKLAKVWIPVALVATLTLSAAAQDAGKQPQMSPEEQKAMEAWMKASTPGDAHKALAPIVGTFATTVTTWQAPGAPPQTSAGTSENRWILGNRYVEQRFKGSYAGMPFEGLGYTGYDNVSKQYWGTWIDNMSTGVMTTTGSSADGKNWTFTGSVNDPMTGKPASMEERVRIIDNDHHVFEMWGAGPDGKQFKMMEISYTRKK